MVPLFGSNSKLTPEDTNRLPSSTIHCRSLCYGARKGPTAWVNQKVCLIARLLSRDLCFPHPRNEARAALSHGVGLPRARVGVALQAPRATCREIARKTIKRFEVISSKALPMGAMRVIFTMPTNLLSKAISHAP